MHHSKFGMLWMCLYKSKVKRSLPWAPHDVVVWSVRCLMLRLRLWKTYADQSTMTWKEILSSPSHASEQYNLQLWLSIENNLSRVEEKKFHTLRPFYCQIDGSRRKKGEIRVGNFHGHVQHFPTCLFIFLCVSFTAQIKLLHFRNVFPGLLDCCRQKTTKQLRKFN